MLVALWIINGLLAVLLLVLGGLKVIRPISALTAMGFAWAGAFPPLAVRAVGIAELLGAAGLVLPLATGIAPLLTPIAASCLTLLLIGGMIMHAVRKEGFAETVVTALAATASAILGFLVLG